MDSLLDLLLYVGIGCVALFAVVLFFASPWRKTRRRETDTTRRYEQGSEGHSPGDHGSG